MDQPEDDRETGGRGMIMTISISDEGYASIREHFKGSPDQTSGYPFDSWYLMFPDLERIVRERLHKPLPVRLFRCDACHAVQAVELKDCDNEHCRDTCACGNRFSWTQIKAVD